MKKKLFIFTLAFIASIGAAFACSCIVDTIENKLNMADVVFTGQVVSVEQYKEYYDVTFEVGKVYKGDFTVNKTVRTHQSSATCGYHFDLNEDYLVFANNDDDVLNTGLCSGTNLLNYSKMDIDYLEQQVTGENVKNFQNIIVEYDSKAGVVYYDFAVMLPTPCHEMREDTVITGNPAVVDIKISSAEEGDICVQVIDIRKISGTINVDAKVKQVNIIYNDENIYTKNIMLTDENNGSDFSPFERFWNWIKSFF